MCIYFWLWGIRMNPSHVFNTVRGMDFTPKICQTSSNPDRSGIFSGLNWSWQHLKKLTRRFQTQCSHHPPLNLQPSHLKFHQKDIFAASVAVTIQGIFCIASYPSIVARGIDLREVVCWALLCCADADGNWRKHDKKTPQPGKSIEEWHGTINHTNNCVPHCNRTKMRNEFKIMTI